MLSRPLTLAESDELYGDVPRSDDRIPDDSVGPYLLAHELMRRAASRQRIDVGPFRYQPEVLSFAQEQLRPIAEGETRSFGEDFLRLWRAERLARLGAPKSQ
jgi:hypothetical protein